MARKDPTDVSLSLCLGHFPVWHCESMFIMYFPGLVIGTHPLVQVVPVIPFALTTRVGVAERDGRLTLPSTGVPGFSDPVIHSPTLGLHPPRRLWRRSRRCFPYLPHIRPPSPIPD